MRLKLPADARSCRAAREFLSRLEGSIPAPVLRDMEIAADELVTQSLLIEPPVQETRTFEILANRFEVTIAVEDAIDPFGPQPVGQGDAATLGLVVVDQVADRWGMESNDGVVRTWATFALPSPVEA